VAEGSADERWVTNRWVVAGRVQGVGFRIFVAREATALGLAGWTRNLPDGRVEVVASGREDILLQLEMALARGPRMAVVTGLDVTNISDDIELPKTFLVK
jgi:acylphosphatase